MTEPAKVDLKSMSITDEQKAKLKQLFPEVFNEDKVDFDKLKRTLGEELDEGDERFGITWPGKNDCFKVIQTPSVATLKPAKEESVNWDDTGNLFIEGDNLEALKLLQKSYYGKVKMIYIDPPYNTGKEFIYPDKFSESLDTYLAYTGQVDSEGVKFSTNTETEGRFHSKWMSMMYPRLFLARNLLRKDGVIFISIGEDEISNLRKLCDDIFGEESFVECFAWNKRVPKNDKGIGNIHEYILLYVKDYSTKPVFTMRKDGLDDIYDLVGKIKNKKLSMDQAEKEIKKLYKKNGYDRGITLYNSFDESYRLWGKINMSWPNANTFGPTYEVFHPLTKKAVKVPDRGWRWKEETFKQTAMLVGGKYQDVKKLYDGSVLCGKIWFAADENTQPSSVTYLDEVNTFLLRSILSLKSDGGIEVENLFEGKSYFSYPKPTSLLKILFSSNEAKDRDIYLDFFAGSATTAHAVMQLNAEDDRSRQFIMVQLPEPCDEKSEAFKAGYKTIADFGKERIRRVIDNLKKSQATKAKDAEGALPGMTEEQAEVDLGFKVFKLDKSNFNIWDGTVDEGGDVSGQIEMFIDHIDPDARDEDILYEILLKSGFELTTKIQELDMAGKKVYSIADNALLICLDRKLTKEVITEMARLQPARVVCLDAGFADNDQLKTNAVQIMKSHDVEDFRTV